MKEDTLYEVFNDNWNPVSGWRLELNEFYYYCTQRGYHIRVADITCISTLDFDGKYVCVNKYHLKHTRNIRYNFKR